MNSENKGLGEMRLTEKVTRNIGILRRGLAGKPLGFVGSNLTPYVLHQENLEDLRERARERWSRGEPITDEMMLAFTEYPFPGMRVLRFRRVAGGWKMTGGPFGGEPGYERDLTFDEVVNVIKGEKSSLVESVVEEVTVGEKRFYYCDNPRHPHGEVVQVLTYERDPKCPICLEVMTYGRYWR